MGEVFCDRFGLTIDRMGYREMRSRLLPILHSVGCETHRDQPGDEVGLWREPSGGTFKVTRFGDVAGLGASGRFLMTLRAADMLGEFLHTLGSEPHKVSFLDATMDIALDAPPVVMEMYSRAATGEGVQLSRKRVALTSVLKFFSQRLDGRESGSVYIGARNAEVRLKVYDKQHERECSGVLDTPPCVRYELTLKTGQATLADVFSPAPLFWQYVQNVLPRPLGVPEWVARGEGYSLPRKPVLEPLDRLRQRLTYSKDIADVIRLADSLPDGRATLLRELGWIYPVKA